MNAKGQRRSTQRKSDPLRLAFVEMLFALAASQVAIHFADLVAARGTLIAKVPAAAHLVVALVLIAASWVGWRQSKSRGMKVRVKHVVSYPFIGLLLDVLLVVLYYVVVRRVEVRDGDRGPALIAPSAAPEAFWILVVFLVYVVWDFVADAQACVPATGPRWSKWGRGVLASISASLVCCVPLLLVWCFAKWCIGAQGLASACEVVLLDVALLSCVLIFRPLKVFDVWFAERLGVADLDAFKTQRDVQGNEVGKLIVLSALYALAVLLVVVA
jgi:hypothetical protein